MTSQFEKSDHMICNNYAALTFQHKYDNDTIFINQISKGAPRCIRPLDDESRLWISQNPRMCDWDTLRMLQNKKENTPIKAGYDAYPDVNKNDFLMIPCKQNTFKNHIECDDNKCCSVNHQLFENITRRR